jgi:hypothetical protein
MASITCTRVNSQDYDQWAVLWKGFLAHCLTSQTEQEYKRLWARILDPNGDAQALVAREEETGKVIGFSHYFFFPTTWGDKPTTHLSG